MVPIVYAKKNILKSIINVYNVVINAKFVK